MGIWSFRSAMDWIQSGLLRQETCTWYHHRQRVCGLLCLWFVPTCYTHVTAIEPAIFDRFSGFFMPLAWLWYLGSSQKRKELDRATAILTPDIWMVTPLPNSRSFERGIFQCCDTYRGWLGFGFRLHGMEPDSIDMTLPYFVRCTFYLLINCDKYFVCLLCI